jgi:hypothetical protein
MAWISGRGQRAMVLMRGPGGEFEVPFEEEVFGGPARSEDVLVPGISRFGEKDKTTSQQNWEGVPENSTLEGLLLPTPPGKSYRLLKVMTQDVTPEQFARLGMIACRCFGKKRTSRRGDSRDFPTGQRAGRYRRRGGGLAEPAATMRGRSPPGYRCRFA